MKIFQIPIILLWGYGMFLSNSFVKIEKKPQIIFEPLGKLVTQFTYANIKIHWNLEPLKEEFLDGCQTALLLNHYVSDYKAQANTSVKRYFNVMHNDILQICIEKLNHI